MVVPKQVRARYGLQEGAAVIFMESPSGLILTTRQDLLARIQSELESSKLVEELLAERRREAALEDAE